MPPNFNIDGASNFRVLPHVRPRTLYRSDHLGALNADDARQIQSLGIRRVLDLRGVDERVSAECLVPDVTVHSLAIEPTIVQVLHDLMAAGHKLTAPEVVAHMQDTYRGFVRQNSHRFAELFRHLLESNEPTVFHCTAGKDRTGFAAALILRSLGASDEDVMRDYLLTNEVLKMPEASRFGLTQDVAAVLWRVQPEFLDAAFEAVDQDYGGLEEYFRKGLGLGEAERKRMRDLYLAL